MPIRSATLIIIFFVVTTSSRAMPRIFEIDHVPISRFVANLEKKAQENPKDAWLQYQIGRFYALGYVKCSDHFEIPKDFADYFRGRWESDENLRARVGNPSQDLPYEIILDTDDKDFRLPPDLHLLDRSYGEPSPQLSEEENKQRQKWHEDLRARALPNLQTALKHYERALQLIPESMIFQLAYAWALDQMGEQSKAIPIYYKLLRTCIRQYGNSLGEAFQASIGREALEYLERSITPDMPEYAEMHKLCEDAKLWSPFQKRRLYGVSPIAVPLKAATPLSEVLAPNARTAFDLDGIGRGGEWSWITPDAGCLVWDPERTGRIESGRQLFGNVTFWVFWENGYDALAALDDDQNESIEGEELIGLAIWRDANSNGISEPGEVLPIPDWDITAFACTHEKHETGIEWNSRGVTFSTGELLPTYDVILQPADDAISTPIPMG